MRERGQGLSLPIHQHSLSVTDYSGNSIDLFGLDDESPSWRDGALCAQVDTDLFYPEKGGSTKPAKRVCAGCDVRQQCLDFAVENDERHGIWGGLSERERRRLKQQTQHLGRPPGTVQPINHGTEGGYAAHRRRKEPACVECLEGLRVAQARRIAARRGAA